MENIDYLEDCQEECQKHSECQFWTWNFKTRRCWRKTVNAPKNLDSTCDTCTSGPRDCKTKKSMYYLVANHFHYKIYIYLLFSNLYLLRF